MVFKNCKQKHYNTVKKFKLQTKSIQIRIILYKILLQYILHNKMY